MRHVEIQDATRPPCDGRVVQATIRRAGLPLVDAAPPPVEWRCEKCGKCWTGEPPVGEVL